MSIWKTVADWFKPKKKTWPNWQPLGGFPNYGTDYYNRKTPTPSELIQAFEDTVFSCASLIADTVASTPLKLYVKTEAGQARPKCKTRPAKRKTMQTGV